MLPSGWVLSIESCQARGWGEVRGGRLGAVAGHGSGPDAWASQELAAAWIVRIPGSEWSGCPFGTASVAGSPSRDRRPSSCGRGPSACRPTWASGGTAASGLPQSPAACRSQPAPSGRGFQSRTSHPARRTRPVPSSSSSGATRAPSSESQA